MLVNNATDLQNINQNVGKTGIYALGTNIDASGIANFSPIGNSESSFVGILNGQGYTISNLTINSTAQYVGLFGYIGANGVVSNLGVTNANIVASGTGGAQVGSIAGFNSGTIDKFYATGSVGSTAIGASNVGGLVGTNAGSITNSYTNVAVNVTITSKSSADELAIVNAGGLVGL